MSHIEIIEKKIKELEEKIDFVSDNSILYTAVLTLVSILFSGRIPKKEFKEGIRDQLEDEKEFFEKYINSSQKTLLIKSLSEGLKLMLALAKAVELSFDNFSSLIIDSFGIENAKHLLKIDWIIRDYGIDNANKWKKLVGI